MGSFIPPSAVTKMLTGEINFAQDRFAVMLLDNSHEPGEGNADRGDLDGEVSGPGYQSGGKDAEVSVFVEPGGKTTIVLGGAAWIGSSLTARYAAYYRKSGSPARDAVVAFIDFGKEIQSLNDLFSLTYSEIDVFTGTN